MDCTMSCLILIRPRPWCYPASHQFTLLPWRPNSTRTAAVFNLSLSDQSSQKDRRQPAVHVSVAAIKKAKT